MRATILDDIIRMIEEKSLLSFTGHKRKILMDRLTERMTRAGINNLSEYRELLDGDAGEEARLLDLVTTNETLFFRNPAQFDYLREEIVPRLEEARGRDVVRSWGATKSIHPQEIMKVRVLSAGCSTGEEPYSIAMTLLEAFRYPKAWNIAIIAGDLSESCLRTAREGVYPLDRLNGIPARLRSRFLEMGDGAGRMQDEVKRIVKFMNLNLARVLDNPNRHLLFEGIARFDMIFCRNVLIYFSPESQQCIIDLLYELLEPGGYLFTGDAEPLHLYNHQFKPVPDAGCLIYRKTEKVSHDDSSEA